MATAIQTAETRPQSLDDFIGNEKAVDLIKYQLKVSIELGKDFPHSLLLGPAGHGKTLLAELVAKELNAGFVYSSATAIGDPITFREVMKECVGKEKSVVLIDEFHALPKSVRTNLLSLLEYPGIICTPGELDVTTNRIVSKKGYITKEYMPDGVTLMFATNYISNIDEAFKSRLLEIRLLEYSQEEKEVIAKTTLLRSLIDISPKGEAEIARRCKNAREISKICEIITDTLTIQNKTVAILADVNLAFSRLNIDENGLGPIERKYLHYLADNNTVGLESIASYIDMTRKDVSSSIEPVLIRKGFTVITSGGRKITLNGLKAIKRELSQEDQFVQLR